MTALLYVLSHSTDQPDRAITGLGAALAAVREGHDVALWLTGEGVRLGIEGVAETLVEPAPPEQAAPPEKAESAADMLAALVEGGAVLCLDRHSFQRRQYGDDALRDGAVVTQAQHLAELLAAGHRAVTL